MNSKLGTTFMFLTKLAWNSKLSLPVLLTCAFMVLNFRWEVEINIHTERIVFQDEDVMSDSDESWETDTNDESDIEYGLE
uniref:CSON014133 protein n=1 Tax=Culicoides sonorensis TaxID=179676 RepID=A0A336MCI8_CULSO